MTEISQAFKEAVEESDMTKMEISWSMKGEPMRLQAILEGAGVTDTEELFMLRFIFKHRKKSYLSQNGGVNITIPTNGEYPNMP